MLGFVLPSFDTPDPLAEQYPHLSPYAHCAANPITLTDPTGMYFNSADSTQAAIYMVNQRDGSFGYHLLNIYAHPPYTDQKNRPFGLLFFRN